MGISYSEYEIKHQDSVRRLAPECMVLLRSDGSFPLDAPGKIALYGSGARRTRKGGTGSGDVHSHHMVSVEEGLRNAGFTITTGEWLDNYDDVIRAARKRFAGEIRRRAAAEHLPAVFYGMGAVMPEPEYIFPIEGEGDTAVYVLSRTSGEGSDRHAVKGDLFLTETEIRDIHRMEEKYPRFLLVLNTPGMIDLSPVSGVRNILLLSQPGAVVGDAFADVLLGKSFPSGKLTDTWMRWQDFPTIGDFGVWNETHYREGIYVGYRYFDTVHKNVLFPFGYGLSCTTFDYDYDKASVSVNGTAVTISIPVSNTGSRPGKEIVEVYVSIPEGRLDQPYQVLAAFAKTETLAPGEAETVTLSFRMDQLASYDTVTASEILEKGDYIVRAGRNSRDTESLCCLRLAEDVTVRRLSHRGGKCSFDDWKPSDKERFSVPVPEDLPVFIIDPDAFNEKSAASPAVPDPDIMRRLDILNDHDLTALVTGRYSLNPLAGIIGSASTSVPGAAGETTAEIPGLPPLVMADGPAGLRLSPDYTMGADGRPDPPKPDLTDLDEYLPETLQTALGNIRNSRFVKSASAAMPEKPVYHQYATALPIGTALAQSWNPEVWKACGDIVGSEMEMFHVDLWLAPGVNIHRNPLCGRNFEYFSEDPLLAGLTAAGITQGVQQHPGRGVTIKHLTANNQETNRYNNNSVISERALRDIYLKPFEICIREAEPAAVMTSYNLVNGAHTSTRADLLRHIVRGEWGYRGLIMSDWVVPMIRWTEHKGIFSAPDPAEAVVAGNNLFMPGSLNDRMRVEKALRASNGADTRTRRAIRESAGWVLQTILRLKSAQDGI